MKNVIYRKREFLRNRGRCISIRERMSDKKCHTRIMKNFIYLVANAENIPKETPSPVIRLIKKIDTESQMEGFVLKIKGTIYVKEHRFIYRIDYCHSLFIRLLWKTHVLSKPAALA